MQSAQPSLFARDDTLLGVCEGLGEDLGINPLWLRLALIPPLFFYPLFTVGGYLAAGLIVMLSRLLFPKPRIVVAEEIADEPQPAMVLEADEPEQVSLAA
jgi:phage shock protein C